MFAGFKRIHKFYWFKKKILRSQAFFAQMEANEIPINAQKVHNINNCTWTFKGLTKHCSPERKRWRADNGMQECQTRLHKPPCGDCLCFRPVGLLYTRMPRTGHTMLADHWITLLWRPIARSSRAAHNADVKKTRWKTHTSGRVAVHSVPVLKCVMCLRWDGFNAMGQINKVILLELIAEMSDKAQTDR